MKRTIVVFALFVALMVVGFVFGESGDETLQLADVFRVRHGSTWSTT